LKGYFIGGNVAYFGQLGFLPWFTFSAATAIVLGLFGVAVSQLRHVGPMLRVPAIAAAWSLGELARAHLGALGITFGDLAYSQHTQLGIIQIASVVGHYGVGFLMALLQASIATVLLAMLPQTWSRPGDPRLFNRQAGRVSVAGFFLIFECFFGGELVVRRGSEALKQQADRTGVRVATVQGEGAFIGRGAHMSSDRSLGLYLAESRKVGRAELIVWPETAILTALNLDKSLESKISGLARELRANLLIGATEKRGGKTYNSAFYYQNDGALRDIYRKMDLVVFGEYVPFRDRVSFFKNYPIRDFDYSPGDARKLFRTEHLVFSPLICFETVFPQQARQVARLGAEVLVIITSDVWAARTFEVAQHSHIDLFRAIESRKYVIRASTNGRSAVYDPYGTALSEVGYYQNGSAVANILPRPALSLYHRLGDWPLLIASLLLLLAGLSTRRQR